MVPIKTKIWRVKKIDENTMTHDFTLSRDHLVSFCYTRVKLTVMGTDWVGVCCKNRFATIEIKPCGLVTRIRDVEAFWYKTEIKIIYFVPLCLILLILLIVSDCIVYPDPKFLIFKRYQKLDIKNLGSGQTIQSDTIKKLKNGLIVFLRLEADFFLLALKPSPICH